mmetsp:Transcript_52549/g.58744  ORF Transcript_52549/g.58744 Transcript_52549/m.58744 type:complete len:823 (+) Transcript_52549:77-2545(+)
MMEALTPNTTFALDENTTLSGILEQQPTFSDSNSSSSSSSSNVENGNGTTMQYTNIEDSLKNKSIKDDKEIENVRKYTIKSIENDDSDNENGNSYWDVLILYLPVLFLWFRRSMFGSANLIRSIVVGQLMRLVLKENFSEWISERAHLPPWLQVLLFQSSSAISTTCTGNSSSSASSTILGACAGSGKLDPHAWPPPAFTALALLTIFALVVHPDGITWIMLGKFRDVILTILSTLGQCWEFLVNDYGVFPTIAAATTFATLLFLVFVVLRTLSPKNRPANGTNDHNVHPHNEKKRRKKKGGNARHRRDHHHHRSNRIKHTTRLVTENNVPLPTHQETPVSSCPISTLQPSNNDSHASLPSRPLSFLDTAANSSRNRPVTFSSSSSALSSISSTETGCAPLSTSVHGTPSAGCEDATMSTISTGTKSNRVDSSANAAGKDFRGRRRMISSGSTIDTTSMSDDQSCGSTSVRSYPSVSVNSNRSGGNGGGVDKITNNSNRTKRKGIGGNPRRGKHSSNVKSPKNNSNRNVGRETKAPVETSVSSRWDALKPGHSDCKNNIISSSRHHHRANGNLNSNKNHHQYQQQQQRYHRGNNRLGHRGGNNGNGTNRKGRHLTVNEPLVIDRNPAMTISGSSSPHSSNKAALTTKSSSARPSSSVLNEKSLPIASTIIRHHDLVTSSSPLCTSNAASPSLNPFTSPSSKFMPPPPPGFQETTKENLHFKEDISTFPPPKLFDTSLPQIIDSWRTEVSSTAPLTAIPQRIDNSPEFFPLSSSTATIQENPFTNNNISTTTLSHQHSNRLDSQIEAELQELGGQMAGSILDF